MDKQACCLILEEADLIYDESYCRQQLNTLARNISVALQDTFPLVLSVMGGAVIFTGNLLPLLRFPLEFDYIHVTRYQKKLSGGDFRWLKSPSGQIVKERTVLILDDILDEGHTLSEVKLRVMQLGAKECYIAVFADKQKNCIKPIQADFVGLTVPNRFVFGYGMDIKGYWRNLPAIYALKE